MPSEPFAITTLARDDERDLMVAAANRLSLCLGDGSRGLPIQLNLTPPRAATAPAAVLVASLRIDEDAGDVDLAGSWRARLAGWDGRVVLVNVFRHVADAERRATLAPQLRRLNLLAIHLSRETGAAIADVDRAFALVGARTLGSDHRCGGAMAHDIAAHAIVSALLTLDLDLAPEQIEAARVRNGGAEALAAIVARHARAAA